jgi:urea transport system ATP-binding protein
VEALAAGYGGSTVVAGVTLRVEPGQVVCLMGRNGVGKTTLLKAVMGVLPVRAGSVSYGGLDLTRRPVHDRARHRIGYVPQGRGVFPYLTVRENLLMGLEGLPAGARTRTEVQERLGEAYTRFPVLESMQRRPAGTLSGGQHILLVEQFLDFALGVADVCYVMEKGAIVSQGAAETLSESVVREHLSV